MPISFESPDICADCGKELKNKVFFIPLCDGCLDKANAEAKAKKAQEES